MVVLIPVWRFSASSSPSRYPFSSEMTFQPFQLGGRDICADLHARKSLMRGVAHAVVQCSDLRLPSSRRPKLEVVVTFASPPTAFAHTPPPG